jgi:hypothetical protein
MFVADDDEMYPGMEVYLCTCNITILHIILVDIFVDLEMETSLLAKVDVFSVKR